jgi:hypothetical protein
MSAPAEAKRWMVVDASVSAAWVLPDESSSDGEALLKSIADKDLLSLRTKFPWIRHPSESRGLHGKYS